MISRSIDMTCRQVLDGNSRADGARELGREHDELEELERRVSKKGSTKQS